MPKVKRSTKSEMLKTDFLENLDPLYMNDLRSLCKTFNLPDTGRRNTLCPLELPPYWIIPGFIVNT